MAESNLEKIIFYEQKSLLMVPKNQFKSYHVDTKNIQSIQSFLQKYFPENIYISHNVEYVTQNNGSTTEIYRIDITYLYENISEDVLNKIQSIIYQHINQNGNETTQIFETIAQIKKIYTVKNITLPDNDNNILKEIIDYIDGKMTVEVSDDIQNNQFIITFKYTFIQ